MTLWTPDLYKDPPLIKRTFYPVGGSQVITTPATAAVVRVSGVGKGGRGNFTGPVAVGGGGAAFARTKTTCTPGETFTVVTAGPANNDSSLTRDTGAVLLMKAQSASGLTAGAAGSCVGDVKRSGGTQTNVGLRYFGGVSAGDDADTFPLGFGGPGASVLRDVSGFFGNGRNSSGPYPGAGGIFFPYYRDSSASVAYSEILPMLTGLVCVEFFSVDPGY